MEHREPERLGLKKFGGIRRTSIEVDQESLIKTSLLYPDKSLPLVVQPAIKGLDLIAWARENREFIEAQVLQHGALLFRDFNVGSLQEFEQFVEAVSGSLLEYRYRASPRSEVSRNIYTSTDYPPDQHIFPHNEHSYSSVFPLRLYFYCDTPAQSGGATPIGDTRKVFARISPEVRERFTQKQILYVRNYGDGFGLPWETVFQTSDKAAVEEYCTAHGIIAEWKDGNRLRNRQVGPAVVKHPRTGEQIWFNHGTFFHVTTLDPSIRDSLLATFSEEDLPNHTYYGDGSPIEPEVLDELRAAYDQEMVDVDWQKGDVLMLDNMLAVHGRNPYVPPRKVVVAMAEPVQSKDL